MWKVGCPPNFAGPVPGKDIHDRRILEFHAQFKVAVCLENHAEPNYFTEKFVNAVRAGCIPVYHAHPTVKNSFLAGAKWVDPVDHSFDPRCTIEHALNEKSSDYIEQNDAWLKSGILDKTDDQKAMELIHNIIHGKVFGV